MFKVAKTDLPKDALLQRYAQRGDCYTDCFAVDLDAVVTFEGYIMAFYRTWLFEMERWILDRTIKRPSGVTELTALAQGTGDQFAAWTTEARENQQVLLCDVGARTRSWLQVQPLDTGTRLYFGSAVVPPYKGEGLGFLFSALLGFHNLYSYGLLGACARDIRRRI